MRQTWVTDLLIDMKETMIWKNEAAVGAAKCLALGHAVRWAMLRELAREAWTAQNGAEVKGGCADVSSVAGQAAGDVRLGTVPVSEMAARLGMKRPAVANHLPQMLAAGVLAVFGDPSGDGRKRCLGLPVSATVHSTETALEVDFGDLVLRFPAV